MLLNRWLSVAASQPVVEPSERLCSRRQNALACRDKQGPRPRVLVVDDDPQVLGAHVRALRPYCIPVAATSAAEAIVMLEQSRFDVLLTDHDMPGASGATLLEAAGRLCPDLRRVVVSGADESVLAEAVRLGLAHEYLCKPVSSRMLCEIVSPV